ncbi:hypothetical protein, partial [Streptomyces narbonensis]
PAAGTRSRTSGTTASPDVPRTSSSSCGTSWSGSWVCLHQGHSIPDLGAHGLRFFGPGEGQGEPVNDRIGSHLWVDAC